MIYLIYNLTIIFEGKCGWVGGFLKFRKVPRVLFHEKNGWEGVFDKFRKVPGYFFKYDSVERVGGGQGAQILKSHHMFH